MEEQRVITGPRVFLGSQITKKVSQIGSALSLARRTARKKKIVEIYGKRKKGGQSVSSNSRAFVAICSRLSLVLVLDSSTSRSLPVLPFRTAGHW